MRLVVILKDGTKMTVENVAHFSEIKESQLFEVNPLGINREIFKKRRMNKKQERIRCIILKAFAEVDKNPEEYVGTFELFIPDKIEGIFRTPNMLYKEAIDYGGDLADWVQQALEWAQRISNGESWETLCNEPDNAMWYRMIKCKNGCGRLVGDSTVEKRLKNDRYYYSPTHIQCSDFSLNDNTIFLGNTVPLIAIKK